MQHGLAYLLAWRLLSHSGNRFARLVTWVSFAGLALGVMVLTVVVTVMNGFDEELKKRLLRSVPHITVDQSGNLASTDSAVQEIVEFASKLPNVRGSLPYFRGVAAISARGRLFPVVLYGLPSEVWRGDGLTPLDLDPITVAGMQSGTGGALLGAPLARALGVLPGDDFAVLSVTVDSGQVRPKSITLQLRGTFELGAEPDYGMVLHDLDLFAPEVWQSMGETGLQIQLDDPLRVETTLQTLQNAYPAISFSSWQSEFGELFQAVQLEKSMMFVLLLLVVAIASFNIIAGQSMLVNDKRRGIAILLTMGAQQKAVRNAFLLQGALISVSGSLIGMAMGLLAALYVNEILAALQSLTGRHLLDGSFFVEVPTRILLSDLLAIAGMSCSLCMLSAAIPARRAARIDPIAALH